MRILCTIYIGNRIEESILGKKIAQKQENCTRQSRMLFEVPKLHSYPCHYFPIVVTYLHHAQAVTTILFTT